MKTPTLRDLMYINSYAVEVSYMGNDIIFVSECIWFKSLKRNIPDCKEPRSFQQT